MNIDATLKDASYLFFRNIALRAKFFNGVITQLCLFSANKVSSTLLEYSNIFEDILGFLSNNMVPKLPGNPVHVDKI